MRIRQAELEYALGREELQLLSLVEEAQALQSRFDKSKADAGTIFSTLQSGTNLSLVAITSNVGKWAANTKPEGNGLWIEWALEGEGLYRGDRLLEVNGILISAKNREDLPRILGTSGKCQLVVLRRKVNPAQHQQLIQSQEDNMRLQHRISYLEEQVKEMQETKDMAMTTPVNPVDHHNQHNQMQKMSPHVTSINITSPPVTPPDKPEVYQRGNFIMTIVGGKPVKKATATPIPISSSSASSASSASSVSSQRMNGGDTGMKPQMMTNDSNNNNQRASDQINHNNNNNKPDSRNHMDTRTHHYQRRDLGYPQHQKAMPATTSSSTAGQQQMMHGVSRSISASSISINSDVNRREKERREREKELRREIRDRFIYKSRSGNRLDSTPQSTNHHSSNNGLAYSKSGDQLHMTR